MKAPDDSGAFGFLTPRERAVLKGNAFHMNTRLVRARRTPEDWSISLLLEVHRGLFGDVFPEHAGRRRTREVTFRQHVIPKPEQIDYRLQQLVEEARSIIVESAKRGSPEFEEAIIPHVATFHANCVVTQPFIDGNKRWSRLLLNALLSDVGYYPGVAIDVPSRDAYLAGIDKSISGFPEQLAELILRSYIERYAAYRAGLPHGG